MEQKVQVKANLEPKSVKTLTKCKGGAIKKEKPPNIGGRHHIVGALAKFRGISSNI